MLRFIHSSTRWLIEPVPGVDTPTVPGFAFAVGQQLLHGLDRQAAVHDHDHGRFGDHGDRHEVAIEVVRHVREYRRIDAELAGMRHQQRVAVCRRFDRGHDADEAIAAGAVLHHDLLAPALGKLLPDDAGGGVDDAARREWNDDPDRLVGIGVGRRLRLGAVPGTRTSAAQRMPRTIRMEFPPYRSKCRVTRAG